MIRKGFLLNIFASKYTGELDGSPLMEAAITKRSSNPAVMMLSAYPIGTEEAPEKWNKTFKIPDLGLFALWVNNFGDVLQPVGLASYKRVLPKP